MTDINAIIVSITALVVAIGHLIGHIISKNRTNTAARVAATVAAAQLRDAAMLAEAKLQSDAINTAVAKALAANKEQKL